MRGRPRVPGGTLMVVLGCGWGHSSAMPLRGLLRLSRGWDDPLRQYPHHIVGVLAAQDLGSIHHAHGLGPIIGLRVAAQVQLVAAGVDGVQGADDDVH